MCKQICSGSFKNNVTYKLFAFKTYMHKKDLTLNNPQVLISHKTQPDQTKYSIEYYLHG